MKYKVYAGAMVATVKNGMELDFLVKQLLVQGYSADQITITPLP